jgi:hypothetical protein
MSNKSTRIDEARCVAKELLDGLECSSASIDALLLRAKRLARLMRDTDAQFWLDLEMKGYPDNFHFATLGTCRKYAASCGRITESESKYYQTSLPELEANVESEQALLSTIKPVNSTTKVKDFVEKNATEALMATHLKLQNSQKSRFAKSKQLYSSIKSGIHGYATDMYISIELGDSAKDIFDSARSEIDNFVRAHCPKAAEKLVAINERIAEDSSESRSSALTTCRRLLMTVADSLFPAQDEDWKDKSEKMRKVGTEQYKNRLLAYMSEHSASGSDAAILESELELIAAKLDAVYEKTCKGVHVEVGEQEAKLAVISTYILLGEIARFANPGTQKG